MIKDLFSKTARYIKRNPRIDLALLAVGLIIFAVITFINAPRASIWFDEAFGAYLIQFSFWDIARFTATDVHPPLYYWVLKLWSGLFGTTEVAFRSLSILFGAATISTAFVLTRRLFGRSVAAVSLIFLILSPMLIRYSDEARMYTLAAFVVLLATHVLLRAVETNKRSLWIWYAVLVAIGMWTHYFTAFAWLAHWAWRATQTWRKGQTVRQFASRFFSKEWIFTHVVAVALYIPWLPFMFKQLGIVQSAGFWIGPVGVDTPANYMTNYFYYLEHDQVQGWFALAFLLVIIATIILLPRAYRLLKKQEKSSFLLVASLAWVPPILLFLTSLPPLRPSFVERYLIPAVVALSIFLAVVLVVGAQKKNLAWRLLPSLLVVGMMIFGITNVYTYGNFNKNSNTHILTRQAVHAAQEATPEGAPIVASSPWVFYEAAPYATELHPVYFIEENTSYDFGSLDMLKHSDFNKIKDLAAFERDNPIIWYLGGTSDEDVAPFRSTWEKVKTVKTEDFITGKSIYKATLYRVNAQ